MEKVAIYFGLSDEMNNRLLKSVQKIEIENIDFIVNNKDFCPHLSLFHSFFSSIDFISNKLDGILGYELNETIDFLDVSYYSGGWYFINLKKKKELFDIQEEVVSVCKEFILKESIKEKKYLSDAEKKYYIEYGYPYVFECFNPHITLLRTKNKARLSFSEEILIKEKISNIGPIYLDRLKLSLLYGNGTVRS